MQSGIGARSAASTWRDTKAGFGIVSRIFHWTMVALLLWQFTSALLRLVADETPVQEFFWSMHYNFGFTIFCLAILRGAWGLFNFSRRPEYPGPQPLPMAAGVVHFTLYLLMIGVPGLALLRAYGSERGFGVFGMQIFAPGGPENDALMELGNSFHGELGWVFLVLVLGHVTMALFHGFVRRDGTLERMTRGGAMR